MSTSSFEFVTENGESSKNKSFMSSQETYNPSTYFFGENLKPKVSRKNSSLVNKTSFPMAVVESEISFDHNTIAGLMHWLQKSDRNENVRSTLAKLMKQN